LVFSGPTMRAAWSLAAPLLLAALLLSGEAGAGDTSLTLGAVAAPPASSGVDRATLRSAAEGELLDVDASRLRKHRTIVVSVAVTSASQSPFGCTVNAVLHDARTGTMVAIVQGNARTEGSASDAMKRQIVRAAVRSAVRQIPDALAAN
jgi:hypothetical protein